MQCIYTVVEQKLPQTFVLTDSCRVPDGGVSRLEFFTDSSRVDPLICGHGGRKAKLEADGGTDEPAEAAGAEWCESLTQGRAPHGSFEISANGPRWVKGCGCVCVCVPVVGRAPTWLAGAAVDAPSLVAYA